MELKPISQTVELGDQATFDVIVTNPDGISIGAYDIFVNYDPSILTFFDVIFGSALGGSLDSIQDKVESTPGTINVSELSFLSDLTSLQNGVDDVFFFSIIFDTDIFGLSQLSFNENVVGGITLVDGIGQPISLDSVVNSSVNVVPLPGSIWLFVCGLMMLSKLINRTKAKPI